LPNSGVFNSPSNAILVRPDDQNRDGELNPHLQPMLSRTDIGINPFQANVRISDLIVFDGITNLSFFSFSDNAPPVSNIPVVEPVVNPITMTMGKGIAGILDETGLVDDVEIKKTMRNKQVYFTPITKDFRIFNKCSPYFGDRFDFQQKTLGVDPQTGSLLVSTTSCGNTYDNLFDTRVAISEGWHQSMTPRVAGNAYACGTYNKMAFLPYTTVKSSAGDNVGASPNQPDNLKLTAGLFGTNQISLTYNDNNNSKFAFQFLHTPILMSTTDSGGDAVPVVVKQNSTFTSEFRSDIGLFNAEKYHSPANFQNDFVDRHSGILLTELTATQDGELFDFWEGVLGFDLNDLLYPAPTKPFYELGTKNVNQELLTYKEFMKKTTGNLYGISFNQDPRAINPDNNNQILNVQTIYTENVGGEGEDLIYASEQASSLIAKNLPSSFITDLGGSILISITGYGTNGNLQDGKDSFAIKSIVSLYYLSDNTYISAEQDPYIYFHTSSVSQTISKLQVRILNPITMQEITPSVLGKNNSLFVAITQNIKLFK